MLKVGLTGGIAAGKSVVGEMFVALGARLVQADRIAHSLMQPGEARLQRSRPPLRPRDSESRRQREPRQAGGSRLRPGHRRPRASARRASRNSTASCIPQSSAARKNGCRRWARQDPHAVAIVEAALLLEAGAGDRFDRLIVVTCSEEQRVARFAARQKIDLETARKEVSRRMAAQLPDEEKIKAADYVIDNSGTLGADARASATGVGEAARGGGLVILSEAKHLCAPPPLAQTLRGQTAPLRRLAACRRACFSPGPIV